MGEAHGVVGENLGTEAEAIRYGSAAELAGQSFAPLSVLLVENLICRSCVRRASRTKASSGARCP